MLEGNTASCRKRTVAAKFLGRKDMPMCHWTCTEFVRDQLAREDVAGKRVLEVGARDVNGTIRPVIEELGPASYIGVDIARGPGVDEVCDVKDLSGRYGKESFDVVVSTELVEHVRDWRSAFSNMKHVLRTGGTLLVTTRSPGFKVHGYPHDFWRYTPEDMRVILGDFEDVTIADDRVAPGVFVRGKKPRDWQSADLDDVLLHSVITRSQRHDVSDIQVASFRVLYIAHQTYRRVLPEALRAWLKAIALRST